MANKELMKLANAIMESHSFTKAPDFHGLQRVYLGPKGSDYVGKRVVAKSTADEHIAFERRTDMPGIEWRTLDEGVDFVAVLEDGRTFMNVYPANTVQQAFAKAKQKHVDRGNPPPKNKTSFWVPVAAFDAPVDEISAPDTDHLDDPVLATHQDGNVVVRKHVSGSFTVLVDGKPDAARQHLLRMRDAMGLPDKTSDTTRSLGGQVFDAVATTSTPAQATETPGGVLARCRAEIAAAFGVTVEQVSVTIGT